jgi:hypothetical protein
LITSEHTKEALSHAYVHALAGMAGLNLAARTIFDYGVDGTFHLVKIRNNERIQTGHPVDFQMKATTKWEHRDDFVVYDLEARAHRLLTTDREPGMPLAILILLCLPKDPVEWLDGCEEHLHLRNCCYWYQPEGPPTQNVATTRIQVPRENVLTPDTLRRIMLLAREKALGL